MPSLRPPQWNGPRFGPLVLALILVAACGGPSSTPSTDEGSARGLDDGLDDGTDAATSTNPPVRPGIDVLLSDSLHLVRDQRVGLITNQTGVGRDGTPSIDLLWEHPDVDLVALYSPEHGIRGDAPPGAVIGTEVDTRTGLTVHSLYGETRAPTPEMLEGVDVLLFDIQDVGARYYTYVSTMALAMEAAGEAGIRFIVLDRPNPIDGVHVQGNVLLDPAFSSFIGTFRVPMRHGLTPGELARLYREREGLTADLTVVPAVGWQRSMDLADTGLPWVPPSPNMPTPETALHYPGTCLFEGTPLSVGRGTDRPFEQVGAPWLDGEELARRLESRDLPDVRFEAVDFTPRNPSDGKFGGVEVSGIRFFAEGPGYDPTVTAVTALVEAREMAGDRWEWRTDHFDLLAGTDRLRIGIEEGATQAELTADWDRELREFGEQRDPHLIYGP